MNDINLINLALLAVAIIVIFRLWSILGQRTGNERSDLKSFTPSEPSEKTEDANKSGQVLSFPGRANSPAGEVAPSQQDIAERLRPLSKDSPAYEALSEIAKRDLSFKTSAFLKGANAAYEMIVTAYAQSDRATLRRLLSRPVYEGFDASLAERESRGETVEFKFVGIVSSTLVDADFSGTTAQIVVEFISQLITATRDKFGEVAEGNPNVVQEHTDVWTFSRDVTSSNPNWQLVATDTSE